MTSTGGGPDLMSIFTYRDETVSADIHRGDQYVVEKIVAQYAGYVLKGCLG